MNTTIRDFIEDYLTRSNDPLNSKISYRTSFNVLNNFMRNKLHRDKPTMEDLTERKVREWIMWMYEEKQNSAQSCNIRLSNIRRCLKKASAYKPELTTLSIQLGNIPKIKENKIVSRKARGILLKTPDKSTVKGRIDAMMLYLLIDTGMSIESLAKIQLKDINLGVAAPYVVHGKEKLHSSPLGKGCSMELRNFISEFHSAASEEDLLFSHLIKGEVKPYSLKTIGDRMKLIYKMAHKQDSEVPEYIAPYDFKRPRKK